MTRHYRTSEWATETALEAAQQHLGRLQCMPVVAVCIADTEDHHEHLQTLSHWFKLDYFMTDESVLERADGSYRGVLLHRPDDEPARL